MSVTGWELPTEEKEIQWMCIRCHRKASTKMNVGFRKDGICDSCDQYDTIYEIASGNHVGH